MEIPAAERTELEALAGSGDESAKAMLDALPPVTAPAKEPVADKASGSAAAAAPKDGDTPKGGASDKGGDGVDPGRDRNGDRHKPSKIEDIRNLRRDRRELREQLAAEQQKGRDFLKRLEDLEANLKAPQPGKKEAPPAADDLTDLLTKPGEFLSAREKRLKDEVVALIEQKFGMVPKLLSQWNKTTSEKSAAIETLGNIKDFDLKAFDRGDYDDEIYELMEEQHGFTEDMVDTFLKERPGWMAARIKKAWETRTAIDPGARSAKAAAGSGAGAGSPHSGGGKVSLEELNRRFAQAKTPEEQDRIMAEIEKFSVTPRSM